jgi:hypothetical protein
MNEPRPPARPAAVAAAWLCFAAAFALVAGLVRAFAPHGSGLERMDVKLDAFAQRKDEFELVFLGSSRAVRGFVPSQFDAELAAQGFETRSFNLGFAGARVTEMLFVLERLVELAPRKLRYVLIDPEDFGQIHDTRNALAQAGILWHDASTTWLAARHVLASERENKFEVLRDHTRACALNTLNVGRTARWVNALLGRKPGEALVAETLGERRDGHTALFDDQDTLLRRRRRFERGRAEYERMVAGYREIVRPDREPAPEFLELLGRVEALVRELGAEPLFVIQPALARQWDLIAAAELGAVDTLLRYDDPDRDAALFAHENRFDSLHLNDAGAALFTRRLADDFANWRRARGDERK